jgi:hypothetical protein
MNRKREQAEIIYLLGRLFGPLEQAAADPSRFDGDEQKRIRARFFAEMPSFLREANKFCNGEPGHLYGSQKRVIQRLYSNLDAKLVGTDRIEELHPVLEAYKKQFIEQVLAVPVPVDSAIYEASTPFSTYCLIRDLCTTVRRQLVWLDRYFDQTIFHRFFIDTPSTAEIILVTLPGADLKSATDRSRHAAFMDISRLFAVERGPQRYRLIENGSFHDRWLRCDDKLFTLGGSIKDLDKGPFTISRLDTTSFNQQRFDDAIAQGSEVFGPTHTTHP